MCHPDGMVIFGLLEIWLDAYGPAPQAAQQLSSRLHQCTDSNLCNAWGGNPAMTFAVIAGIHGETLNMWLKGVRYLGRTPPTKTTTPSEPTPPIAALAARSPKAASSRWSAQRRGSSSDRSERLLARPALGVQSRVDHKT